MKGKLYIVLCLVVVATLVIIATPNKVSAFSGSGSGTAGDPYVITNVTQLQEMNDNLTAYYILGNDIDASATTGWNGGAGFVPIGSYATTFIGNFDGRGYKIINLFIYRPSSDYVGLFGYEEVGTIENVGIENENIYGHHSVGGLAGETTGTVTNCYTTGYVTAYAYEVGGLVGVTGGTILRSYSTSYVIENDWSSNGEDDGGLVGDSYYGTIANCYSTGAVSGNVNAAGLLGRNYGGTVSNCYSATTILHGYGLVGITGAGGTVSNSFWDTQSSGQPISIGGGTGKTTDNMKNVRTYTDNTWSVGLTTPWDNNIWNIENGSYPSLHWVSNVAPTTPTTLTLTGSIKVGQVLTATASGSMDNDNDNITYYYRFYDQTKSVERQAYSTTSTYTIQVVDAHDNIRVFAKAYDGHEYSSGRENSIVVSNSLPVVGLVAPDNGTTSTSLTPLLDWTFADNDGDTQVKYWVVVDNDNNFSSPVENTGEVASSATIYAVPTPLSYSTKYYWEVKVYDNYEWSGWYGTWNFTTGSNPNFPPNKPTNLLPSARGAPTNVTLSCVVVDNDVNPINVFFYDNSDNSLIDNIWIASGGTAHVTWGSRTRGNTYSFFTRGQDNNGAWGDNSDVQSFKVNTVPTCSISLSISTPEAGQTVLFMSNAFDNDNDNLTYAWDFGDGSTSNLANPSHTYSTGTFTVTLHVNDGYENSAVDNTAITAHTPPTPTGGGPSWVPAPVNKIVKPYSNVLFRSITMIGPFSFNLFWALVIVIILAWRYEKGGKGHIKGIMWSSLLLLGFLFIFGSGLGIL